MSTPTKPTVDALRAIQPNLTAALPTGRVENLRTTDVPVMETPQSRSAFMSLIASMLDGNELKTLTAGEFDVLVAKLAGEVMSNSDIHAILKDRVNNVIRDLRR